MTLILSETNDGVTTITLNRPDKLNAFAGTMREDLLEAILAAGQDPDARVVVITGAGRAFCAGGDIDFMSGLRNEANTDGLRKLLEAGARIVTAIQKLPQPVIASINGVAAGAGCNLALACDIRIASDAARFSESFVRIGLHPDWGGTWLLPRIAGPSRAMEMLMTGRMFDAPEALACGIVDRVVDAADLVRHTSELARSIASGPPIAIRGIKRAVNRASRNSLEEQLALETEHQIEAFLGEDAREGMAAFLEKRTAKFEGR